MSQHSSKKAVIAALLANASIGATKFTAAIFTGSGAMLAEAIHSAADCANQLLLLIGMTRMKKLPSQLHHLGYGREIYIWSMMVAFLLFSVGGLYSIYKGVHRIMHPEPLEYAGIAAAALLFAVIVEGISLRSVLKALAPEKNGESLLNWFKRSKNAELLVVTAEDIAALAGLFVAFLAITATIITGNPIFDAFGSLLVGALLVGMSYFLTKEIMSLLIGERADEKTEEIIRAVCEKNRYRVLNLTTVHHGNEVLVAIKATPHNLRVSAAYLINEINKTEAEIKQLCPTVSRIFFEPDNQD